MNDQAPATATEAAPVSESLASTYAPSEGVYDEMVDTAGQVRQHWHYVTETLAQLGAAELDKRRQEIHNLLRDNGVTYTLPTLHSNDAVRLWELDLLPCTLSSQEWITIERGVMQRAELLNLLLHDLYSDARVLSSKIFPPELIFSHPGFLPPCKGTATPERYLHLYASDLVRTATGQFMIIGDRSHALAGAGYALENRIVMSRVFPSLFRDAHVHRLAQFFRTLRKNLQNQAGRAPENARVVMLSPGEDSETYFEQAYLAKYLGYTLVQGADLAVREGRTWLKTLDGLQPVDVIFRWLEGRLCDPLELQPDSFNGTVGLTQSMRMGNVFVANPLGTEVVENRALMQFLPALAHYYLNEDLLLDSPPTYWCGLTQEREYVLANLDQLVLRRTHVSPAETAWHPETMSEAQKETLRTQIRAMPLTWVAQEKITGSEIPIFSNGRLEPRKMVLRTFAVADEAQYQLMPGGLARVVNDLNQLVATSDSGGISKDVWVLASEPERQVSLLNHNVDNFHLPGGRGELPSRVAENLFWLGRYVERAEGLGRLLRTVLLDLLDPHEHFGGDGTPPCLETLLRTLTEVSETLPGFIGEDAEEHLAEPSQELSALLIDTQRVGTLAYNVRALLFATRAVRDRISPDLWRVFNDIEETMQRMELRLTQPRKSIISLAYGGDLYSQALDELNNLLLSFAAVSGLALESMTHGQGWSFLIIGRRLERAYMLTNLLRAMLGQTVPENEQFLLLEALLNICDSQMTYRSRYRTYVRIEPVLDLLLQDETNPRALSYQLERLQYFLSRLPRDSVFAYKSEEERLVLNALTTVRLADPRQLGEVDDEQRRAALDSLLATLQDLLTRLSDAITNSYFSHAEQPQQLVQQEGEHES